MHNLVVIRIALAVVEEVNLQGQEWELEGFGDEGEGLGRVLLFQKIRIFPATLGQGILDELSLAGASAVDSLSRGRHRGGRHRDSGSRQQADSQQQQSDSMRTMSARMSFPLLSILTHRRSRAASFLCGSLAESFRSMHSKADSFANMANSRASR